MFLHVLCYIVHVDGAELSTLVCNQTRGTGYSHITVHFPNFIKLSVYSSNHHKFSSWTSTLNPHSSCYHYWYSAIFCHKAAKEFCRFH